MAQHTLRSGCIAVAAACALASGALPLTAAMASADSPSETVVPAALLTNPPKDLVVFAGTGGFLHQPSGSAYSQSGYVWTKYAGGPDIPVPEARSDVQMPGYSGAGSDIVAGAAADGYHLHDMDSGTTTTIRPGAGQRYMGTFGSRVLTVTTAADGTVTGFHVLGTADGQQTDTPVTGWPEGATPQATVLAGDADSVVIRYIQDTGGTTAARAALVDLATGAVTPVSGPLVNGSRVVLSDKYIAWYTSTRATGTGSAGQLQIVSRSAPSGSVSTVQVPAAPLGSGYSSALRSVGIGGDSLLFTYSVSHTGASTTDDTLGYPLYTMPLSGSTTVTPVLDHADVNTVRQGPDGVVAVGGSSVTDWAARRFTAGPDGTPMGTAVDSDPPVPAPVDGLSLAGGKLFTVRRQWNDGDWVWDRTVQPGSPPSYGTEQSFGSPFAPTHCDTAATCNPPIATGDGNISQLWPAANSEGDAVTVQSPGDSAEMVTPGATGGTLVDAEGPYVVYNGGSTKKQYIGDADMGGTSHVLFSRPISAAALSGSTVWVPGSTAGTLTQIDLTTQRTVQTVPTDAPCVPSELQAAAQHWVYWSCGPSGPAGVHDLATGEDVPVPTAGPAQLGDGVVVEHDTSAGKLTLTDVHTGTATTTDLAGLPAGPVADDRRVSWAVDKYQGGIAYLDSGKNVHLVDPHIPASTPAPAAGAFIYPGQQLAPGHSLSSSTMTLTMQTDGNLVARLNTGKGAGQVVWSTGTSGNTGAYAVMQTDGNLVVYTAGGGAGKGGALWSSRTYGHAGAYATVQDDGNIVVYNRASTAPLWSSGTYARPQSIYGGTTLKPGWWTQGTYTRLVMQTDGNLVLYRRRDGAALWSSRTYGHPGAYAVMQTDGNLVVYKSGGGALWSTGTNHHSGAYAMVQNDGNVVVYTSTGGPGKGGALWATGTSTTAR
ncbi:hypothetical protein [Streptomyces camelliae]|uniref:Bulb-type lectin domain-containing protein n=1 Tax=Streptomyces camelliae TaxID=3004093 RepID=A0ABY7P1N6_9ACTN|nr:hypothetical protein [Streptomyces sp. HUAS 2-6]WBO64312.1 hypothetical protein O1G22_16470 [Streptomyces sp. HUAS 2-6]